MFIWQTELLVILLIVFSGFDLILSDCGADDNRLNATDFLCYSQRGLNHFENFNNRRSFEPLHGTAERDERVSRQRADSDDRELSNQFNGHKFRRIFNDGGEQTFHRSDPGNDVHMIRRETIDTKARVNDYKQLLGSRKKSFRHLKNDYESRLSRFVDDVERRSELRDAKRRGNHVEHGSTVRRDHSEYERSVRNDIERLSELRDAKRRDNRVEHSSRARRNHSENERSVRDNIDRRSELRDAKRLDNRVKDSPRDRRDYSENKRSFRAETERRTEMGDNDFMHGYHYTTEEILETKFTWKLVQFALIGVIVCKMLWNNENQKSKSFGEYYTGFFRENVDKTLKIS